MPPKAQSPAMPEKPKRYKMRLVEPNFVPELGGKLASGSVHVVDEDTAIRWLEHGIATQAGNDEQTEQERKREQLRKQLVPLPDDESGVYDAAVLADPGMTPRGRRAPARLKGAGVVNSLSESPDDDDESDQDDEDK